MIPIESYFKTYGARNGIRLVAKAIDQEQLVEAQDEARVLLRSYRHLRPGQDDNFTIFASETFVTLWERLTATIAGHGGGHRFGLHGGGRHRDHEHHAGGGDGAHARNRHSQIAGRAAARHPESIPGGIVGAGGRRRPGRAWQSRGCWRCWCAISRRVPMALPWSSVSHRRGAFGHRWACSSASIRRGRRPSWTPSKPCGRSSNR